MFGSTTRRWAPDRGARGVVAVLSALLLLLLGACSSSSGSDGGSSGKTDDAAVAAAQKRLDPYLTPVKKIEVDTPLTKKPQAGKTVDYIRYNNPTVAVYDPGFKQAAAALGWDMNIIAVDATDPQAVPNAMIRAVSEHADFIVVAAADLPSIKAGMAAAKNAGVPVFLASGVGVPEGKANGLYGNTRSENTMTGNLGMVDQAIVDSGGTGSILFVNAPDFPVLAPLDDAMKKHVAESCSECSLHLLGISAGDLGGDIASQVVNAIRQHPDVKYVVASFDTLTNGLPQALAAAGMDDVKIYISAPGPAAVKLLEKGDYDAGLLPSDEVYPWLVLDQVARVSVGMDPLQKEHGNMTMQLWTTKDMPKGQTGWAPPSYQDQFKKLWQVS
jgi:ABC-type sugar transport system substrate-binding protein